jgi:FkbM family methyltransferase
LIKDKSRIAWGPLKGFRFTGGDLACRLGVYELHVQYALSEMLRAGDVFYDVGANTGYLSLLGAGRVGPAGFVYAFEPLPLNAQRVQILMAENGIDHYEVVRYAVSNHRGKIKFYLGEDDNSHTPSIIRGVRTREIGVDAISLDDFVVDHRTPDLIKMDIEGAESVALGGAVRLLTGPTAPKWLIEVHSDQTEREVRKILLDRGYDIRSLPAPFARNPYPTHLIAIKLT